MIALWKTCLVTRVCTSSDWDQSSVVVSVAIVDSIDCDWVDRVRVFESSVGDRCVKIDGTL